MTDHLHDLAHDATTVLFRGAKGGVGTSTVTALHALVLARTGSPTTLTATSNIQLGDLAAIFGISPVDGTHIDVNTTAGLAPAPTARATIVIDGGTRADPNSPFQSTTSSSAPATSHCGAPWGAWPAHRASCSWPRPSAPSPARTETSSACRWWPPSLCNPRPPVSSTPAYSSPRVPTASSSSGPDDASTATPPRVGASAPALSARRPENRSGDALEVTP